MVKIEWIARFAGNSGYSEAARQYCIALKRLGADLICTSIDLKYWRGYEWMADSTRKNPEGYFKVMHDMPFAPSPGYYTTFEFNTIPEQWYFPLKDSKVVMVPSEFTKTAFSRVIDGSKVHVINHGVSPKFSPFGPSVDLISDVELPEFKFLSVFEWVERKCGDRLVKAFQQEFGKGDDVGLFIKTRGSRKAPLLVNKVPGCKIYFIDGFVHDMAQLYRAFDAYISCSSGEGWGETLSEAMACGLPTIGTNHGGNLEFMNDENSFLVDVEEWQPVGYNSLEPIVAPWMQHRPPRVDAIADKMRFVYENRDTALVKERAKKARRVGQDFTWEKAAKKIIDIVEAMQHV